MQNSFQTAFNQGFEKVVIIGSDCWDLSSNILDQAFQTLDSNDFVIGPAEDGGYYLLGMSSYQPKVFQNKEWSTANVLVDTLLDIKSLSKSHALLDTISDVDVEADLPEELRSMLN